jgi:hypothetical protein
MPVHYFFYIIQSVNKFNNYSFLFYVQIVIKTYLEGNHFQEDKSMFLLKLVV